jgi:hypothetical protein
MRERVRVRGSRIIKYVSTSPSSGLWLFSLREKG